MVSSVTSAPSAQPAAPSNAATTSSKQAAKPEQSSGGAKADSVQLSSTAQAQLSASQAARQEATETAAQTAKEASGGDLQAQRLLAREAAQSAAYSPSTVRGR